MIFNCCCQDKNLPDGEVNVVHLSKGVEGSNAHPVHVLTHTDSLHTDSFDTNESHCCCQDENLPDGEVNVVHLTKGAEGSNAHPVHVLTHTDSLHTNSFDATESPRTSFTGVRTAWQQQQIIANRVKMPRMRRYHEPPGCPPKTPEYEKQRILVKMYEAFVVNLHKGVRMTQITMNQKYSDIHCQLLDDLQTLTVDEDNGCRVQLSLCDVSKMHRVVKNADKQTSGGISTAGISIGSTPMPPLPLMIAEHIASVEFTGQRRRKLSFVFGSLAAAQKFLICMELLIRRAKELRIGVKKYPMMPPRHRHISQLNSSQHHLVLFDEDTWLVLGDYSH